MKHLTSSVFSFVDMIQGNFLYVDKTEYIWRLIEPPKEMYFLARPRRFGKSLTVSTLKAVFEGKKELFKGLALYDKPYEWKTYPVVHLDLNGWDFSGLEEVKSSLRGLIRECAEEHHVSITADNHVEMFRQLLKSLSEKTQIVLLLDEYDKPILNNIGTPVADDILKCLKNFYSVIKAFEGSLRLAFITGVSKFCHVSLFSDLNNLTDITMDARYATMLGYTQEELETNFADRLEGVAAGGDLNALKSKIKKWYNGYRFEENAETVYNPVSIAKFFESGGKFKNYWFSTGTPSFLMDVTKRTNFNFEAAFGNSVSEVAFSAFEIDNIDPLVLLLQTGYLTIKSTERKLGRIRYFLGFPNQEVEEAFSAYILKSYAGKPETIAVNFAMDMAEALMDGDLVRLRKVMEVFFAGIPYNVHKKNEATFQAIFFALFRLLGVYIEAESCTNDGRIDAVAQTDKAIYLFEFKMDDDLSALDQIKQKQYFQKYLMDKREIHLIGVNFDSMKGNLIGWETGRAN